MNDVTKESASMVSVHFEGVTELLDFTPPENQKKNFYANLKTRRRKASWYGRGNSVASEVIDKALLGDPYLYGLLSAHIAELDKLTGYHTRDYTQVIQQVKRRKIKDAYGDELDIHKVYQGRMDTAWTRTERIEVGSKQHLVTLLIDLGGHAGQNAADSVWRAAIAVKLVRELEQAGKSVRIVAGLASRGAFKWEDKTLTATINLKVYNQQITLERLAAMSHFGFMRTFCFAGFYAQKHALHGHLGAPVSLQKSIPIQLQKEIDKGHTKFVYIGQAMNSSSALTHLKKAYEQMEDFAKDG